MNPVLEAATAVLVIIGAGFSFIGALGLMRLPDFFMRLHGPSKATTLGIGGTIAASVLFFIGFDTALALRELLITVFVTITTPVSAHLLARAALHRRLPLWRGQQPPDVDPQ